MSKGLNLFIRNASKTPAEKTDLNPPPSITNAVFVFFLNYFLFKLLLAYKQLRSCIYFLSILFPDKHF